MTTCRRCIVLLWLACFASHVHGQALDPLISGTELWQTPAAKYVHDHKELGFHWLTQTQDQAETQSHKVTLFKQPVYQVDSVFTSGSGTLASMTVSIYNRGDAGNVTNETWTTLLQNTVSGLTALTKAQPVVRGKDASDAVKAFGVSWQTPAAIYLLEYSFTREVKSRDLPFRAEFMRLKISPIEKPKSFMAQALASTSPAQTLFNGPSHVKKDVSGDVSIQTVPMVDQGEKGYCVVATAERVLRYYGIAVDENELAELANTSAAEGTSDEVMFESLKKLAQRLQVRIRTINNMDATQFLALINQYNLIARRKHADELPAPESRIYVQQYFSQMNPDLLKQARTHNKSDMERFKKQVQDNIDVGIPVLWTVMYGLLPETNGPKAIGGHMRLIIGYNSDKNEILYSDSWGRGHELKRMPAENAWTMTMGLNAIEPIRASSAGSQSL